jgi:hypothetical protein
MFNQEWEIKPRATLCGTCQKPFNNGQVYVSSLRVAAQGYDRVDCCETCWKQAAATSAASRPDSPAPTPNEGGAVLPKPGDAFSVWRGTFQAELPPPEVLKKETAESLLRKLIEKNDPHFRNSIFILAVMLERKRILAEKEAQKKDDDTVVRVYEHRQTGETFIITDPMLNLDQIGHVQEEIATFLSIQETPAPQAEEQKENV